MSFRLVPKSVTLNDLERRNGHYFALFSEFGSFRGALRKSDSNRKLSIVMALSTQSHNYGQFTISVNVCRRTAV